MELDWGAVEVEGNAAPEPQENPEHGKNVEAEMDEESKA